MNIKLGGTWVFIRPKMEAYVMTHGHMEVGSIGCAGARGGQNGGPKRPAAK